ncbi:MAG: ion transporter [Dorea sp.]|nr:ion transporter [Dorea sp.]
MKSNKISKQRVFDIIQIGRTYDLPSKSFDIALIVMILSNLFIAIFETFEASTPFIPVLDVIEFITVIFFTVEYGLRVWTADLLFPKLEKSKAIRGYVLSWGGLVDLLSFFPYYLPFFMPTGIVAFRMFRIIRILRLFRVNAYSDALSVVSDVIKSKRDQLISSVFILFILMTASSLCMYSLEHEAQPEVFANAFSGFWWAIATLTTVGYGDIYPITMAGKIFGGILTFLGVGVVAIPTGILSAGFVEQYSRIKLLSQYNMEENVRFIRLFINEEHPWKNMKVEDLPLPPEMLIAIIYRNGKTIIPREDSLIKERDQVLLAAEGCSDDIGITLKEFTITERHPWAGRYIKDLDLSKHELLVLVRRDERVITPRGNTLLAVGDSIVLYTKKNISDSETIAI